MGKRRKKGEGSVRQRKDGRWELSLIHISEPTRRS